MSGPRSDHSLVLQETADLFGAFPKLMDVQVESLSVEGKRRATARGDVLFREGDLTCDFFVVLSGSVAIVDGYGRDDRVISVHGPGRFLGELGLLIGEAVFTTAVVQEPGEVLAVPARRVRKIVAQDPVLGDLILRAYLVRRSILVDLGVGLRIVDRGSRLTSIGYVSSLLAIASPTDGSTWRRTLAPRPSSGRWGSVRKRRPS